jgi:hypothetical protein
MKPFRVLIKGKPVGNWKANINGKVCDLGEGDTLDATQAFEKAQALESPAGQAGPTVANILGAAASNASPAADPEPKERQAPGTIRAGGLEELSPALLKKFRETFAAAIADGNYSLDRALIGVFGYVPPNIPEDNKALLKIGWELACQKYFTDGVPPPWIVILFANVQILAKLADGAVKKPEPKADENAGATPSARDRTAVNKNESPVG